MQQCLEKTAIQRCNQSTLSYRNQLGYSIAADFGLSIPARATIQPVSPARKPVIVRKLTRDWCAGYAAGDLTGESAGEDLEMLDGQGKVLRVAWDQVKWVCYVREPGMGAGTGIDTVNPERLLRRRFSSRPRMTGLWLRITLVDGEELEGVAANDRSLLDGPGLLLTPPDTRSNTQRVFVPRSAIRELIVLAVIGTSPAARQRAGLQPELFDRGDE